MTGPGVAEAGFEDVLGGFDLDYNDNRFRFTGVDTDPPVAADDGFVIEEDVTLNKPPAGVLTNDTDIDGDPLTAVLVSGPANGTVILNPDGSFSYQPAANWHGTDTFTYKANDGQVDSNEATVTITIPPVNDEPNCTSVRGDVSVLWPPNHNLRAVRIHGGSDIDGDSLSITITGVTQDEPVDGLGDGDTSPDAAVGATPAKCSSELNEAGEATAGSTPSRTGSQTDTAAGAPARCW